MRNDAVRKACPCTASWKLRRIFKDFSWADQRCSINSSSRFWTGRWWNYKQNKWSQSNSAKAVPFIFQTRQKHRWLFHKYPLPQPSIFKNLSSINKKYLAPIYFLNSSRHLVFLKPKVYTPVLSSLVSLTLREPTDSWVQNLSVSVNFGCLQEALTCIW